MNVLKTMGFILVLVVIVPLATDTPPFPSAPLCPDVGHMHDNTKFHTVWNAEAGCHYDHEHGLNPFTPQVAETFPTINLLEELGQEVGHTNPSSPEENGHKHEGFKWDVTLEHSVGCTGTPTGVNAFVAQYHAFGPTSMEFETRNHTVAVLMRQCRTSNPTDYGYVYTVQLQDYGQRVRPYQGDVMPYPDTPVPSYHPGISPYFSTDCFDDVEPIDTRCRASRQFVLDRNANVASTWVGRPQGAPIGSRLAAPLFRVRDVPQINDRNDTTHPFTFLWLCSNDQGVTYAPLLGCRWNNTTTRIHEWHGTIQAAWDNLPGFDTDARVGRITGRGFVNAFGTQLLPHCTEAGGECYPIVLDQAFAGPYISLFGLAPGSKGSFSAADTPERDQYFCFGMPCSEGMPGAQSAGWIGAENQCH